MTTPWTLIVLAAGVGSRYGGPKQLDSIGPSGETLSDYTLWDAFVAGASQAVFVVRPELATAFRQHHRRWQDWLPIRYASQVVPGGRRTPWGTTEALLIGAEGLDEAFLAVNADDHYGRAAIEAAAEWFRDTARQTVTRPRAANIAFPLQETLSPHGPVARALLEADAAGRLTRITERHDLTARPPGMPAGEALVSMNCWAFTPAVTPLLRERFDAFRAAHAVGDDECRLPETIQDLVVAGRLEVDVIARGAEWHGLTHSADRRHVVEAIQALVTEGRYPPRVPPDALATHDSRLVTRGS